MSRNSVSLLKERIMLQDSVFTLRDIVTVTDTLNILLPHYVDRVRF